MSDRRSIAPAVILGVLLILTLIILAVLMVRGG